MYSRRLRTCQKGNDSVGSQTQQRCGHRPMRFHNRNAKLIDDFAFALQLTEVLKLLRLKTVTGTLRSAAPRVRLLSQSVVFLLPPVVPKNRPSTWLHSCWWLVLLCFPIVRVEVCSMSSTLTSHKRQNHLLLPETKKALLLLSMYSLPPPPDCVENHSLDGPNGRPA